MAKRKVITIANLRYVEPTNTVIDMDVSGVFPDPIPFTFHPNDAAPVAQAVKALLAQGGYVIAPYVQPDPLPAASGPGAQVVG